MATGKAIVAVDPSTLPVGAVVTNSGRVSAAKMYEPHAPELPFTPTQLAQLDEALTLSSRTTGLQDRLTRNKKDQDRLEDRVAATEKRLRAQYSALDTRMAGLNSLQSYLTQQITGWNKSS